jgi:hypothetical protein
VKRFRIGQKWGWVCCRRCAGRKIENVLVQLWLVVHRIGRVAGIDIDDAHHLVFVRFHATDAAYVDMIVVVVDVETFGGAQQWNGVELHRRIVVVQVVCVRYNGIGGAIVTVIIGYDVDEWTNAGRSHQDAPIL